MTREFQVGDYVYVGKVDPHKTTWQIEFLDLDRPVPRCRVISGQSGRRMYEVRVDSLTLHTPAPTTEGAES